MKAGYFTKTLSFKISNLGEGGYILNFEKTSDNIYEATVSENENVHKNIIKYEYDDKNRNIKETRFDEKYNISKIITYSYEGKLLSEICFYEGNGSLIDKYKYYYNSKNFLSRFEHYIKEYNKKCCFT